jgi:hypothetical protein
VRTFTATDACGNSAVATQTITVQDTTAPVFEEQQSAYTFECGTQIPVIEPIASDNCGEVTLSFEDQDMLESACEGSIVRTWTATDECDNSAQFVQTFNVIDETAPVISGSAEIELPCDDFAGVFVSASDNCDENVLITSEDFEVSGGCQGRIIRTYTAADDCGNSAQFVQIITLTDETAPMASGVSEDFNVECGDDYEVAAPSFMDNCDDELELNSWQESGGEGCETFITYYWSAEDNCDNITVVSTTVNFVDTTEPFFTFVPEGGYFSCDEDVVYGMAEAVDICNSVNITFSDVTTDICGNSFEITRTWTATDLCGNDATATSVYLVFDNQAPTFDQDMVDVYVECVSEIPAPAEVTATDNCGEATVTASTTVIESDECGNQTIRVNYLASDACENTSTAFYFIYVNDETAPELVGVPANLQIECGQEIPAPAAVTAIDNCGEIIEVTFEEFTYGEGIPEDAVSQCQILTPALPAGNSCNYPVDWAMALFAMPSAHRYYQISEGTLTQYEDGTIHVSAVVHNAYNPNNGFEVEAEFINGMNWNDWSTQAFLTSFKADCGGIDANHPNWMYYLLNNSNATLTGIGGYAGSFLTLAHAPSNNYFGFQLGDGANNYNGADNGFGGWFSYSGLFLVDGQQIMAGNASGAGDFAFELNCCPEYTVVRCWTAMDCSGNITQSCQTISTVPVSNEPTLPAVAPAAEETVALASKVSVYPNPAIATATFAVQPSESAKTMIEVIDMTGLRVGLMELNQVIAGNEYKVSMDVSNLAAGIYMYRVTNGSVTEMGRMIVAK